MLDEQKLNTHMDDENLDECLVLETSDELKLLLEIEHLFEIEHQTEVVLVTTTDGLEVEVDGMDDEVIDEQMTVGIIIIQLEDEVDSFGLDKKKSPLDTLYQRIIY